MTFYMGTHIASWLPKAGVPLFVSRRRLHHRRTLPTAAAPWALDSGGFTELQLFGRWSVGPARYADEVRRFADGIGLMEWAAPQDWMCEPIVLAGGTAGPTRFQGTGKTVREHQRLTVENFATLRQLAPELPWAPVLQGFRIAEYVRCARLYEEAGVDLGAEPRVGVGSVCRRQATREARDIFAELAGMGLRLHGFGVKVQFLADAHDTLASCDSLAWSAAARRRKARLPGCPHMTCANCLKYALRWRASTLRALDRPTQPALF